MAKSLDTILKVLGIVIAALVILAIIVLLLRVLRAPTTEQSPSTTAESTASYWYDPNNYYIWDWLNYPWMDYFYYPRNRRHHDDNHHNKPNPTLAPMPAPTLAPMPAPTLAPMPAPTLAPVPIDIIPEVTINNSLTGALNIPIISLPPIPEQQSILPPVIQPIPEQQSILPPVIQPIPEQQSILQPVINTNVISTPIDAAKQLIEGFEAAPEPCSNITSLPEAI